MALTSAAKNRQAVTDNALMKRKPLFPPLTGTIPPQDWDRLLMRMLEPHSQPQGRLVPTRFPARWVTTPTSRVRH